jgi:hypothetical protein
MFNATPQQNRSRVEAEGSLRLDEVLGLMDAVKGC